MKKEKKLTFIEILLSARNIKINFFNAKSQDFIIQLYFLLSI